MSERTTYIKKEIYNACKAIAKNRVITYQQAIKSAQDAAGSETKSTAGDKHETGRAMAHLEQEKNISQLTEAQEQLNIINRINPLETTNQAVLGSIVITNKGKFYISISAGKIEINNVIYFAVSLQSPIGKAMVNLKNNDSFIVNNQEFVIEEIF